MIQYRCAHCGGLARPIQGTDKVLCEGEVHCQYSGYEDEFEVIEDDVIDTGKIEPANERQVDELRMLVQRLAHKLKKVCPDSKLADQAVDYLKRNNLQGSPLRQAIKSEIELSEDNEPVKCLRCGWTGTWIELDHGCVYKGDDGYIAKKCSGCPQCKNLDWKYTG